MPPSRPSRQPKGGSAVVGLPTFAPDPLGRQGSADTRPSRPREEGSTLTGHSAPHLKSRLVHRPERLECVMCDVTAAHRLAQSRRVEKFDDCGGLGQPPKANSSFSRITLSDSGRGNSGSRSGVIALRNSLISVRQSSSVRSRGHSACSGSQQVIGSIPSSLPLCGGFQPEFCTASLPTLDPCAGCALISLDSIIIENDCHR